MDARLKVRARRRLAEHEGVQRLVEGSGETLAPVLLDPAGIAGRRVDVGAAARVADIDHRAQQRLADRAHRIDLEGAVARHRLLYLFEASAPRRALPSG